MAASRNGGAPAGPRVPVDVLLQPFRRFASLEAAGGILLLGATLAALVWANSPWAASYTRLWEGTELSVGVGSFGLSKPLLLWVNDLLMAAFFLLVGLEIKREMLVGELASPRRAAVPIVAAVGGMAVPGAIYAAINAGTPEVRGWGIPMATDIAFALGVMALLGGRTPAGLRVFLASLAIIDDLGALLVIAFFYTDHIDAHLAWAGAGAAGLAGLNLLGARRSTAFVLVGLIVWYHLLKAGVHPTIAGVLTAMAIPARSRIDGREFLRSGRAALDRFERSGDGPPGRRIITNPEQIGAVEAIQHASILAETPLQRLEHNLLPWVSFLIVPVFALANAGVALGAAGGSAAITGPVPLGIGAGLVLGKPVGILLASYLAVRTGLGTLPAGVSWRQMIGMGCLAGIGFTMSLFIAALAFTDPATLAAAKGAVLGASLISGIIGFAILRSVPGSGAADAQERA